MKTLQATHIISTIPLDKLAEACRKMVSEECLNMSRKLLFMDMQLAFFVIKSNFNQNENLIIYSFEKHHRWKRLSVRPVRNGLYTLTVEATFKPEDEKPIDIVVKEIENNLILELKLFGREDILTRYNTTVRRAYPVYDIGFENRINSIIQEIQSKRIKIAGRQGLFYYTNSSYAIQTAIDAVEDIFKDITDKTRRD